MDPKYEDFKHRILRLAADRMYDLLKHVQERGVDNHTQHQLNWLTDEIAGALGAYSNARQVDEFHAEEE